MLIETNSRIIDDPLLHVGLSYSIMNIAIITAFLKAQDHFAPFAAIFFHFDLPKDYKLLATTAKTAVVSNNAPHLILLTGCNHDCSFH